MIGLPQLGDEVIDPADFGLKQVPGTAHDGEPVQAGVELMYSVASQHAICSQLPQFLRARQASVAGTRFRL
jgi:hypothetical protein